MIVFIHLHPYDKIHHSLLLDFLGSVVGRYPDENPDAVT